ncbi:MAG: S41 family peptidase [bacterium]
MAFMDTSVNSSETRASDGRNVRQRYVLGLVGAALLLTGFLLGSSVGDMGTRPADADASAGKVTNRDAESPQLDREVDFARFWDVWQIVKTRSVKQPVDDVDMFYGAVSGMVGSLGDPYSIFLDPEVAAMFESELSGTFQGIGAEIGIKQDQLKVIAPLPGTPAERAGLRAGDSIIAIDGVETFGLSVDEAVSRIRGDRGTEVKLLILRPEEEAKEYSIVRDTITVDSIKWRMEDGSGRRIGVIEVSHFNETTGPAFEEAVQGLLLQNPDGLILDLRNNPGGFLDTAVDMAGEWIQHDVVVQEKFSDGSVRNYNSDGTARFADLPTVVLVNGGSASASEIVAGALQQRGRATVVGEQTFGKGSVQDYVEFEDGSALKLTIALWLTPNGESIDQSGITPDQVVELTVEDFENDRDPQFDRAVEILSAAEGSGQEL